MPNNQIEQGGAAFANGQLVTASRLNDIAGEARLLKGAISEQTDLAAVFSGTYNYASGTTLDVSSPTHQLLVGDRVKLVFSATSGANGSLFSGVYSVSEVPSDSTFRIALVPERPASAGNVSWNQVPTEEDAILIYDASDVAKLEPKKVSLGQLVSGQANPEFNDISANSVSSKTINDLIVSGADGIVVTDATYGLGGGLYVTVTKASHNLVVGDIVEVSAVTLAAGSDVWVVASQIEGKYLIRTVPASNQFTYELNDKLISYENRFKTNETFDLGSANGTLTYKKLGSVDISKNAVVSESIVSRDNIRSLGNTTVEGQLKAKTFVLPSGRTDERPTNPNSSEGQVFFDNQKGVMEIFRKNEAVPDGSWETLDKTSNTKFYPVNINAENWQSTPSTSWRSKTLWTSPDKMYFKQILVRIPPLRFEAMGAGGTRLGKIELIAAEAVETPAVEHVIAHCNDTFGSTTFGYPAGFDFSIQPWTEIITPSNIDLSNMKISLRLSQSTTEATGRIDIRAYASYFAITPLARSGGEGIATPWEARQQDINGSGNSTWGGGQRFGLVSSGIGGDDNPAQETLG